MRASCLVLLAACSIPTKVASNLGDDAPIGQGDAPARDASPGDDAPAIDGAITDGAVVDGNAVVPTVMLLGKPNALDKNATVTFTYSVSPSSATIECRVDGVPYAACPGTMKSFTVVDGSHTFDLRATDQGVTGSIPQYAFAVDTVKPVVTISTKPPMNTASTSAAFTFATENGATLTCTLDTQQATSCMSSTMMSYSGLGDGAHTFVVTATDAAGNAGTAMAQWTVTTTGPSVTINTEPPALTKQTVANFTFTVTGATAITCNIESTSPAACTTSAMYSSLPDGPHTFTIVATDAALNKTTQNYPWTVDTMPPALAITSAPHDPTNQPDASLVFTSGADATTLVCSIDGLSTVPCASPWPYTGLPDGPHTFSVTAVDLAGNSVTKTAMWTVDTVPPTLSTISASVNALTNQKAATFSWITGSDTVSVTCQLDTGSVLPCTTSTMQSYAGLGDGAHTITVVATDAAGNTAMQSFMWKIDTVPPTVTLVAPFPANPTNVKNQMFNFTASDNSGSVTTLCFLDNSPMTCNTGQSFGPLADGGHTFYVQATDGAANSGNSLTRSWLVDATQPSIGTIMYTCDSGGGLSVMWTESDAGSGIASTTCTYGGTAVACGPTSYSGAQKVTGSVFAVTVTDGAGNVRIASKAITVSATICQ